MKAIAKRGEQYLVNVEGEGLEATGQILDQGQQKLFPQQLVQVILKWGYWEPFEGDVDLGGADFVQSLEETHSRSKCMECDEPPVVDVQWADGRGRAWFCLPHFKEWIKGEYEGDDREIVRAYHVIGGEVPEKIGEGDRIKKMGEELSAEEIVKRVERSVGMKEAGYVWNEGPGRGWWGPPKGDAIEAQDFVQSREGGPGSGHHGHAGRPGKRGGSVSGESSVFSPSELTQVEGVIQAGVPSTSRMDPRILRDDHKNLYYSPLRPMTDTSTGLKGDEYNYGGPGQERWLATKEPLGIEKVLALELQPVNKKERGKLALKYYRSQYGSSSSPVFIERGMIDDTVRGAIVHPASEKPGLFRTTSFNNQGFTGHFLHTNEEEAAGSVIEHYKHAISPDAFEDYVVGGMWTESARSVWESIRESGFAQREARRLDDTYKPEYFEKWMDWDRHVRAWGAIQPFLRGQSFLDVGCGMGFALKQLQSSGYVVRGTEVSPWAIGFCAGLGLEVDKAGATKLPYEDDSFDTVFSMFLLDEVPKKAIAESIRVAKMRAVHLVPDGEKWEEGRLVDGFRVMVHDKEKMET